jgi:hypothetical protein
LYGIEAPVGSWVVAMKIEDKEQWKLCKENGTGFSIEGMFNEKVILNKVDMDIKNELKTFGEDLLKGIEKVLFAKQVKLAEWKTEDGSITLVTETEVPAIGGTISIMTPDGNVPAPIGDYILNDGTTISVAEVGIIGELSTKAEEQAPTEEMNKANAVPDVAELKNAISSMLIKFNEDLEVRLSSIETKLSKQEEESKTLKTELSATPAVEKTVVSPKGKEVELSALERYREIKKNMVTIIN